MNNAKGDSKVYQISIITKKSIEKVFEGQGEIFEAERFNDKGNYSTVFLKSQNFKIWWGAKKVVKEANLLEGTTGNTVYFLRLKI